MFSCQRSTRTSICSLVALLFWVQRNSLYYDILQAKIFNIYTYLLHFAHILLLQNVHCQTFVRRSLFGWSRFLLVPKTSSACILRRSPPNRIGLTRSPLRKIPWRTGLLNLRNFFTYFPVVLVYVLISIFWLSVHFLKLVDGGFLLKQSDQLKTMMTFQISLFRYLVNFFGYQPLAKIQAIPLQFFRSLVLVLSQKLFLLFVCLTQLNLSAMQLI